MVEITRQSDGEDYTQALARALASLLVPGDVILLEGDLGAGKTTFVRGLAHGLGIQPSLVSSPTFVMINQYQSSKPGAPELVHADAYRLQSADDLDSVGWERFIEPGASRARPSCILAIEWPERIAAALPPHDQCATVSLTAVDPATRRITLSLPDDWRTRANAEFLIAREPTRCKITGDWVEPTSRSYPFATEKARLADLNRWFRGDYSISRPVKESDLEEGPAP